NAPDSHSPLCLVHNEDCKLSLNPAALAVLRGVTQPVVVVAMVGPLGSGKSFLMKRLAQKCTGSPLGSAAQTQTKGIWMWCLPHPCKPGVALVLLDTEGLGEANKGDSHSDIWIFTLALLLSSTFVFNCKQSTNDSMLQKLLMDLTHHVRVRVKADKAEPADEFVRVFPGFVWVVRDFRLQEGQQPISGDEYLRQILHSAQKPAGLPVQLLPPPQVFMLEQPAADRDLARLEALREDQLQPQFRQHEEDFCQHIWKEAPVKVLLNRSQVTGRGEQVP
uniref:GB1/RHD3-type G domain-containing protein n=1 Tax=Coturnix japonica TaxID=93934 RepID=A0A8C2Y922_COTJA